MRVHTPLMLQIHDHLRPPDDYATVARLNHDAFVLSHTGVLSEEAMRQSTLDAEIESWSKFPNPSCRYGFAYEGDTLVGFTVVRQCTMKECADEPLGSVGAKGNLLQTGEKYTYRPISGLDHIFTLDGERMIYNNGSSVYIVSTSSTQVFDVIDWSNDILRGYWMSADERVLCVLGLKKLLFYDVRNSSIIGVANQFGSIARFQWSTLDRQFYIWHNHSKFGLYDLASIPLSVHETARVQSMCSSEFYIDDGRLCMNAQSPLPVSWQLFDLTGNFVAGSSATSTSAWQECALDIATQPLLLRVDYGDSECSMIIPYVR